MKRCGTFTADRVAADRQLDWQLLQWRHADGFPYRDGVGNPDRRSLVPVAVFLDISVD